MSETTEYAFVIFSLGSQRFALPCQVVKRIIQRVEITPLPNDSDGLLGVINIQGQFVPIIDIRHELELTKGDCHLQDLIIIAFHKEQDVGFIVNDATFAELPENVFVKTDSIMKGKRYIEKIIKDADGPVHVLDIQKIVLPLENSRELK